MYVGYLFHLLICIYIHIDWVVVGGIGYASENTPGGTVSGA